MLSSQKEIAVIFSGSVFEPYVSVTIIFAPRKTEHLCQNSFIVIRSTEPDAFFVCISFGKGDAHCHLKTCSSPGMLNSGFPGGHMVRVRLTVRAALKIL